MPTYEYLCKNCHNAWEEMQKISEPAQDTCPKCHQKTAQRQISGGNFILKGGGWYADLYSSTKPSSGKDSGGSSGSSETKSDATTTSKDAAPATTTAAPAAPSASSPSSGGSSSSKE